MISSVPDITTLQRSTAAATTPATPVEAPTVNDDFDVVLRGFLGTSAGQELSEEDLFAGLVRERINTVKGSEAASAYDAAAATQSSESSEGRAIGTLQALVQNGTLTTEEGDAIYSQAFAAAQLDDNKSALYDARGSANDPTRAVAEAEAALIMARAALTDLAAGTTTLETLSLSSADTSGLGMSARSAGAATAGVANDGPNGFLFKPVSENQGTLAVLLPESLAYLVSSVVLRDAMGAVIESGQSTGYGELGTREKFSFSKPGGSYSGPLSVEAQLSDGTVKTWAITDPSQRYD